MSHTRRSVKKVKHRLSGHPSVRELQGQDQNRVYKILKVIGSKQPIWTRELLRHVKGMDNRYLLAAKSWLLEKDYISEVRDGPRKYIRLTERGGDELIKFDTYFSIPEPFTLGFEIGIGDKKSLASVKVESTRKKRLTSIEEVRVLTIPRLHRLLVGFVTWLVILLGKEEADTFTVKLGSKSVDSDLLISLAFFWVRYKEIIQGGIPRRFDPLDYADFCPPNYKELELYRNYWRKVEEEAKIKVNGGETVDFGRILGWGLDWAISHDEKLRRWIDRKLDQDPDWFMPHRLWVQLGFKQRRSLNVPSHANPPSITVVTSQAYGLVDELNTTLLRAHALKTDTKIPPIITKAIRRAVEKNLVLEKRLEKFGNEQVAYASLLELFGQHQTRPELYEAWRYVREHNEGSLNDVFKILDAALLRYIFHDKKPDVNLTSVFEDLVLGNITGEKAVEMINEGHYKLEMLTKRDYTWTADVLEKVIKEIVRAINKERILEKAYKELDVSY
jgi:hypothetical protein